jgi:hypothetical protein
VHKVGENKKRREDKKRYSKTKREETYAIPTRKNKAQEASLEEIN